MENKDLQSPTKAFGLYYSEALLIAVLSGYSYVIAFLNEQAYLDYFGVPSSFVELRIEIVVYTFSVLLLIAGSLYQILDPLARWFSHPRTKPFVRFFLVGTTLTVVGIFTYLATGANWLSVVLLSAGLIALTVDVSIVLWRWIKSGQPWRAIEERWNDDSVNQRSGDITDRLIERFGKQKILLLMLILIVFPQFAKVVGYTRASQQRTFMTAQEDYHLITIRGVQGVFVRVVGGQTSGDILLLDLNQGSGFRLARKDYPNGVYGRDGERERPTFSQFWQRSIAPMLVR